MPFACCRLPSSFLCPNNSTDTWEKHLLIARHCTARHTYLICTACLVCHCGSLVCPLWLVDARSCLPSNPSRQQTALTSASLTFTSSITTTFQAPASLWITCPVQHEATYLSLPTPSLLLLFPTTTPRYLSPLSHRPYFCFPSPRATLPETGTGRGRYRAQHAQNVRAREG